MSTHELEHQKEERPGFTGVDLCEQNNRKSDGTQGYFNKLACEFKIERDRLISIIVEDLCVWFSHNNNLYMRKFGDPERYVQGGWKHSKGFYFEYRTGPNDYVELMMNDFVDLGIKLDEIRSKVKETWSKVENPDDLPDYHSSGYWEPKDVKKQAQRLEQKFKTLAMEFRPKRDALIVDLVKGIHVWFSEDGKYPMGNGTVPCYKIRDWWDEMILLKSGTYYLEHRYSGARLFLGDFIPLGIEMYILKQKI